MKYQCDAHFDCVSCQVYIPLITAHQMKITGTGYESGAVSPQEETSGEGEEESPVKSSGQFTVRDELLNRMYKYLGMVNTTLQHLQIQGLIY